MVMVGGNRINCSSDMKIFFSQKLLLVDWLYIPMITIEIIALMRPYAKEESPSPVAWTGQRKVLNTKPKLFWLTWKLIHAAEHQAGELFAACVAKETRNWFWKAMFSTFI